MLLRVRLLILVSSFWFLSRERVEEEMRESIERRDSMLNPKSELRPSCEQNENENENDDNDE